MLRGNWERRDWGFSFLLLPGFLFPFSGSLPQPRCKVKKQIKGPFLSNQFYYYYGSTLFVSCFSFGRGIRIARATMDTIRRGILHRSRLRSFHIY
ncbi:hypothetical protein B0T26DRAFT_698320 [Lasiosphaeria miniovina]|uniref:Uncharacterized protein n=1 Tax=Lasiosphaeria miniovina TaxID=1954250 RepID=A0AA40E535_9PEZI|nr:uncharacterized protein B0T26DRAFT_698320 [Lasiosphaeria miniovina]KAK0728524.1 hypothetical protein B0T26DRAFT_698320 [Lasiosphaeria miniovina]